MENVSKLVNITLGDRFEDCPPLGDTANALSLKFLIAVDEQERKMKMPFRSFSENFGEVMRRFIINFQPQQPINSEWGIQFIKSGEMVGSGQKLELYKEEIEDTEHLYFRVYPLTNHLAQLKLKEIEKEVAGKGVPKDKMGNENNIKLLIRKPNNQYIELPINKYSPLKLLKLELCKMENLDFEEFSLVFFGKKMLDEWKTLEQYGMEDESIVLLAVKVNMGCFSPDSWIETVDGKKRAGDLVGGEEVLSYNYEKKVLEVDTIVSIHRTELSNYLQIGMEDGTTLSCTANHNFLTSNNEWRSFSPLSPLPRLSNGDSLLNSSLRPSIIASITHHSLPSPVPFLHICTQSNHSFLLNGLISHNMEIKVINTQDGSEFSLNIIQSDTIKLLKLKIEQVLKMNKHQIKLVLNKKELKDNESIADYLQDIKNCHHLEMVVHEEHTLVVCRVRTKKEYRFKLDKQREVRDLKKEIGNIIDVDRDCLILILNNVEMLNSQKIGQFQLHRNFNRISLIEIEEGQITASKASFEMKKILHVRITENEYLRLNYYSLRQMRIEHFILSFIPNSKKAYTLLFGELTLHPCEYLKEIEKHPIFNNEEINCYVVRCFDRLAFFKCLKGDGKYNEKELGIIPSQTGEYLKIQVEIKKRMEKLEYVYDVKAKFNEKLEEFIFPLQHYSNIKSYQIIKAFLTKFVITEKAQVPQLQGYGFCCSLMKSLQAIPPFVGETHRLLKDTRFRQIYTRRGQTLYFQSLFSTHANIASINLAGRRNYTILHIQSLTGRQIGLYSDNKDEIVFLPFAYFFINKIKYSQDFDEAWLIQMPSPLTFQRDIFMWVDDEPNSKQNKGISNLIDFSRYELVQLVSTEVAQCWMREFGWLLKWSNKGIKVMSDMNRKQGENGVQEKEAGLNLIESFHNNFGYTIPIFIFCKNVSAARKSLQSRKVSAARVQKITNDEFQLLDFLGSP